MPSFCETTMRGACATEIYFEVEFSINQYMKSIKL